jgi:hypothetical protein
VLERRLALSDPLASRKRSRGLLARRRLRHIDDLRAAVAAARALPIR